MQNLITEKSVDYELLDSGDGQKLERYGKIILSRPDPQALWPKSLPEAEWKKSDAVFTRVGNSGKWLKPQSGSPDQSKSSDLGKMEPWVVTLEGLTFNLELLPSKHLGLFPEQSAQWKWLANKISNFKFPISNQNQKIKVLNLFGYTGGASLACSKAGASVCHVDASKFAVDLANKNMKVSLNQSSSSDRASTEGALAGLSLSPIRFIVDDVRKFVEREIKRGNKYDIILMDPPVYGKGAKGETWKIEEDLMPLLSRIKNILSPTPLAIVLNGYASGYSATTYAQMLESVTSGLKGQVSSGELTIQESSGGRLLPCGIFTRWEN